MLNDEVKSLKYALTCRIELKNTRTNTSFTNNCNCEEKTKDFISKEKFYEESIIQLNNKIDELNDERTNLFDLISKIAANSDSGNE